MKQVEARLTRLSAFACTAVALLLTACAGGSPGDPTATATPTEVVAGLGQGATEQPPDQPSPTPTPAPATATPTPDPAACLLGAWEMDNDSYLAFVQATTQGVAGIPGDFEAVHGKLRITFDGEQIHTSSEDFAIDLCGPNGCLPIAYEHLGSVGYQVEGDVLTVEGGGAVAATLSGITEGDRTAAGHGTYRCTPDQLVLETEGFPPLTLHRVRD